LGAVLYKIYWKILSISYYDLNYLAELIKRICVEYVEKPTIIQYLFLLCRALSLISIGCICGISVREEANAFPVDKLRIINSVI
jgi:hypothetical protein